MARQWRIQYPEAVYHVMSRGVNRAKIFIAKDDYLRFIEYLEQATKKFNLNIFAFVLMGNHYHLLFSTPKGNLVKAMQWLQTSYSVYCNKKHRRSGHLFQGRYKAILVEDESYWTGLSYYIHLNPIRARMVTDLAKYQWSSYPAYLGKIKYEWLSGEEILRRFGRSKREQVRNYRQATREISGKEKEVLADLKFGFMLGGRQFVDWIAKKFLPKKNSQELPWQKLVRNNGVAEKVIIATAKRFRQKKFQIIQPGKKRQNDGRDVAMYVLYSYTGLNNHQIGKEFSLTPTAITKAARRIKDRIKRERKLRKDVRKILNSVFKV